MGVKWGFGVQGFWIEQDRDLEDGATPLPPGEKEVKDSKGRRVKELAQDPRSKKSEKKAFDER